MAEVVLTLVASTLIKTIVNDSFLSKVIGVRRVQGNLLKEVEILKGYLGSAEGRQEEDPVVRKWMSAIKDLAYEAEEIVENQVEREKHQSQLPKWNAFKRLTWSALDTIAFIRTAAEVKALTRKIARINSNMKSYGIEFRPPAVATTVEDPPSLLSRLRAGEGEIAVTLGPPSRLVGLDSDIAAIVDVLVSDGGPRVISVCGDDGLGKTTLVKEVVKRSVVKDIVWASLGPSVQEGDVLRKVLFQLLRDDDEERNSAAQAPLDVLGERIGQILQVRRCLVVLDDFQTPATWNRLFHTAFSSATKLVLTTRDQDVLRCVDPQGFLHQPRCLTAPERWQLFQSKVASIGRVAVEGRRKKIAIAKMDGVGFPLTIHLLGGLFAYDFPSFKRYPALSHFMYTRYANQFSRDLTIPKLQVDAVLQFSTSILPPCLRSCLLELSSHYPEGEDVPASDLIKFWIDGGICNDEAAARSYLDELVKRGLIQLIQVVVETQEGSPSVLTETCQLHTLIRHFFTTRPSDASSQ